MENSRTEEVTEEPEKPIDEENLAQVEILEVGTDSLDAVNDQTGVIANSCEIIVDPTVAVHVVQGNDPSLIRFSGDTMVSSDGAATGDTITAESVGNRLKRLEWKKIGTLGTLGDLGEKAS
ncbi:hypothetical protein OS493_004511 [Desmophyllum pertusum]|uniref:Uncharacterized protein n=1 Tax=Desmophyllum pertusum TaxID=174260 RepID=A0A9W9ZFU1_9CNID|nr:hypothetical protein OS493_004511 [Desmophyllum pertusum]